MAVKIVSIYSVLLLQDSLLDLSVRSMPWENVKVHSGNVKVLIDIEGCKTSQRTSRLPSESEKLSATSGRVLFRGFPRLL